MKKFFSCLIAMLILVINIVPCFAQAPVVSVGASTTTVSVGSTVSVYVKLSSDSNLTMVKFNVNYQTSHFELVPGSVKTSGLFSFEETNESTGSVSYIGASDEGVVAGDTLVRMEFKVLKGGGTISIGGLGSTGPEPAVSRGLYFQECAHENMKWEEVKTSTCKEQGVKKGTCSCGYTKEEKLPLSEEHQFNNSKITKEPTCTEAGLEVGFCAVCGKDGVSSPIPAKGHKGEWITTREPTQLMDGEQRRQCTVCKKIETKKIAKLSTTPEEGVTEPITNPIETPTQPITPIEPEVQSPIDNNINKPDNDKDKDKDDSGEKKGLAGLFGEEMSESDKSAVLVIVLCVVIVITLAIYVMLLQQRKKKE